MAKTKRKKAAKPRRMKRAKKATKVARRSQAQPEKGKIHYLLRNIPKPVWSRFLATRSDARFDLLTYITKEAEKAEPAPTAEVAEPTPEPAPVPEADPSVPSPAPVIEEPAEPVEEQPEVVNQ